MTRLLRPAGELLFLLPALAACGVLARLHPEAAQAAPAYLLYAAGFLILPSYALGRLLLRQSRGFMERTCLGFPVCQGLLFTLAWGGSRLGLSWWCALALPALGLFAVWDLLGRSGEDKRSEPFVILSGTLAAAVALALCCISFARTPLPLPGAPAALYYDDSLMAMGIMSAQKAMLSGLPYLDARFGDIPATYHILHFVNNAVAQLLTGAHPIFLQLFLSPILTWSMLAGGLAAGCRRLAGFGRAETVLAALLVFFSSGREFTAIPWMQSLVYFHTYFASLPAAVLLFLTLFGSLSGRLARLPALYTTLLFLAASAAKSVLLLLTPLSLLPVLAYRAWTRRLGRDDLFFSAGLLATALLLRTIEYHSAGQLLFKKFNLINSVLDFAVTGAELAPYALLLLLLAGRDRLCAYKVGQARQYLLFAGTMFLLSVALTRAIEFVGGSQYFFWYARLAVLLGVSGCLGWAFRKRIRPVLLAAAGVTAAALLLFAWNFDHVSGDRLGSPAEARLDRGEWDGLLWAFAHLDHDKRFLCNRTQYVETVNGHPRPARTYDYLAASGLYGYAWQFEWLPADQAAEIQARLKRAEAFWNAPGPTERRAALRALPVDYLFVNKWEGAPDCSGLDGVRLTYSNPSLAIYDLRGLRGPGG